MKPKTLNQTIETLKSRIDAFACIAEHFNEHLIDIGYAKFDNDDSMMFIHKADYSFVKKTDKRITELSKSLAFTDASVEAMSEMMEDERIKSEIHTRKILIEKSINSDKLPISYEELDDKEYQKNGIGFLIEELIECHLMENCNKIKDEIFELMGCIMFSYHSALACGHKKTMRRIEKLVS